MESGAWDETDPASKVQKWMVHNMITAANTAATLRKRRVKIPALIIRSNNSEEVMARPVWFDSYTAGNNVFALFQLFGVCDSLLIFFCAGARRATIIFVSGTLRYTGRL
jgi:hypothetical protein